MKASSAHKERSERKGISPRLGGAVGMVREGYLGRAGLAEQERALQRGGVTISQLQIILCDVITRCLLRVAVGCRQKPDHEIILYLAKKPVFYGQWETLECF